MYGFRIGGQEVKKHFLLLSEEHFCEIPEQCRTINSKRLLSSAVVRQTLARPQKTTLYQLKSLKFYFGDEKKNSSHNFHIFLKNRKIKFDGFKF